MNNIDKTAIELIAEERKRQIEVENYSIEDDKKYIDNELAYAASSYLMPEYSFAHWPFEFEEFKPCSDNRIRELVKAGALVVAEIERLQAIENELFKCNCCEKQLRKNMFSKSEFESGDKRICNDCLAF